MSSYLESFFEFQAKFDSMTSHGSGASDAKMPATNSSTDFSVSPAESG
jgi:hypothetical protein